jgi:two-component system, LuxR family, sensor histidine kinase TtrS
VKRTVFLWLVMAIALCASNAWSEIKIGVLAQRGPEIALKEWGGLGDYLSGQLGEKVTIVPVKFSDFMQWCDEERSAFIFCNPWFYVRANVLKGAKALVTAKYSGSGTMMGGVIFARKDSGMSKLEHVRGKVVLVPKLSSPGGWLFAKGEMIRHGIVPERDLKLLLETEKESHDEVVYAVKDGKADVGTVRTKLLETMQREGKINLADFVILNATKHDGFSEVCSTPLYPDWPVASLGGTPPDLATKMKQVLMAIPAGHPCLEQARKIECFVPALDYEPVRELCKFLNAEPYRRMRTAQ